MNPTKTRLNQAHLGWCRFKQLTQSVFPNNKTWLSGLKSSSMYNGKLYGVPYYAGVRAMIYRKDQYKQAGIKGTPKTLTQFMADGRKLMKKFGKKDPGYSAVYFPGPQGRQVEGHAEHPEGARWVEPGESRVQATLTSE